MIEEVYTSINSNANLDEKFKDNLKELINIFNKFFPMVSLENLNERIKTLKVDKINKLISKEVVDYNSIDNILLFSLEEIEKNYDIKHVLMHGLIRIITAHDNTFGFNQNDKFLALNIGYTEIITNFVIGNSSEFTLFDDEVIATNLIAEIIGNDVLFQAYFTNNPSMIAETLINKGVE